MIERIGARLSMWAERWVPDPFIFALGLTLIAALLALLLTDSGSAQVLSAWGKGFWELLAFAMQMCLVLVTGHALATSGPVKRAISMLASIPSKGTTAAALVAFVACVSGLLNWGLGIIVGALMAREVALRGQEKGRAFHYPLLAAAGYTGLLVWHGGLSGSAPLLVATKGHFLQDETGLIPISQTIFSTMNILVVMSFLVVLPILSATLHPREKVKVASDFGVGDEGAGTRSGDEGGGPARWIENSRTASLVAGLMGAVFLVRKITMEGFHPDLNFINLTFLSVGLLLHKSPKSYAKGIQEGTSACAGIILQFPFYAGIMGIMKYTGLMKILATFAAQHVGPAMYPIVTFLSAGIVNLFVPSGGGQWAVQGPVVVEAAQSLHVSLSKTLLAVAYGDEWTNMFQPFWALPLLGITRLRAAHIMGYTLLYLIAAIPIFVLALLLIPI